MSTALRAAGRADGFGAMAYLVPPLAIILGAGLLGELPPPLAILGGAMCIGGVVLARSTWSPWRRVQDHDVGADRQRQPR